MSHPACSLIVALPGEDPVRHDLGEGTASIGRSPDNDIQILVAEVSVRHGKIEKTGEGYLLVDNGSTNGTLLNGNPVGQEGATLSPMDRLVLGTVAVAYFVPVTVLESTPLPELMASLEAEANAAVRAKTAPVATSAPAATPAGPGKPAIPVKPALAAPVRPAKPVGGAPAAPGSGGASTVRLDQVRSAPGVRPAAPPSTPRLPVPGPPAGGPPKAPGAPGVKPPVAAPLKPGVPSQPGRPPVAPPAGGGSGPKPIPLKRPDPASPTIPLPKSPPKPGQ